MHFNFKRVSIFHGSLVLGERLARKRYFVIAALASLGLSACVVSEEPLLKNGKPTLGQQFDVHLYERFAHRQASEFHASSYSWKDGQYARATGLAQDVTNFVYEPLGETDFLIQGNGDKKSLFNYWIGRRLIDGVYLVFPLNEMDADAAVRESACAKDEPAGICRIATHDDLLTLARAGYARVNSTRAFKYFVRGSTRSAPLDA